MKLLELLLLTSAVAVGVRSTDWIEYGGNFYASGGPTELAWSEARAACLQLHPMADLPSIHSYAESQFLRDTFGDNLWIGMNDLSVEGHYVWSDRSDVHYTEFDTSRREGTPWNCASMHSSGWQMDSCILSYTMSYVCKIRLQA